jgi:hypothetical protein
MSQLALDTIWPCDICNATGEDTDPETLLPRVCRVCKGEGLLDYDPSTITAGDPFEGMQTQ